MNKDISDESIHFWSCIILRSIMAVEYIRLFWNYNNYLHQQWQIANVFQKHGPLSIAPFPQ